MSVVAAQAFLTAPGRIAVDLLRIQGELPQLQPPHHPDRDSDQDRDRSSIGILGRASSEPSAVEITLECARDRARPPRSADLLHAPKSSARGVVRRVYFRASNLWADPARPASGASHIASAASASHA